MRSLYKAAAVIVSAALVLGCFACGRKEAPDTGAGTQTEEGTATGQTDTESGDASSSAAQTTGSTAATDTQKPKVNKGQLSGYLSLVKNYNYENVSNPEIMDEPIARAEAVIADENATQEEADMALQELKTAFAGLGDSSSFARVGALKATEGYPDPFVFLDGHTVETAEDWTLRAEELSDLYQYYMYGYWRDGETVEWTLSDTGASVFTGFGTSPAPEAKNLTVKISANGRSTSFSAPVFLPDPEKCPMPEGGYPYIVCMHDIQPRTTAVENGYAVIVLNTYGIASDNTAHNGSFYELYPYTANVDDQTGVLMAWSWSASKVLDAVYGGADKELGLNADYSLVTGVSRWGKATAVCGAFEKRIKMVIPSCSGAGGLALYRLMSEGRTYDFSSKGAPAAYTYGTNEPLGSLTSSGEKGWFNNNFAMFTDPARIPLEQYMLASLCADPDRYYFVIGSCISEDWVNAPSMWACYRAAHKVYDFLGLSDHLVCNIHKEGHAVIEEDMQYIIAYFDKMVRGIDNGFDISVIQTSVFEEEANVDDRIPEIWKNWVK